MVLLNEGVDDNFELLAAGPGVVADGVLRRRQSATPEAQLTRSSAAKDSVAPRPEAINCRAGIDRTSTEETARREDPKARSIDGCRGKCKPRREAPYIHAL
jgi:hypothetical protein